ncbi:hypothetical protein C1646_753785 [Rhizophagus diaphanus]|nr:hypothetical protein C1646_753785 [Rhizophagus diaphanus] [Rhizophagus sp. MUCL 43196]
MIFIVVQVNEGAKILTGPLAKEMDENDSFSTLFDSLTSGKYSHYNVQVEVKPSTGPWVLVDEGLEGKILLMKMHNFTQLKYILIQNQWLLLLKIAIIYGSHCCNWSLLLLNKIKIQV